MCKLCANKKNFQEINLESLNFTSGPTWARTRDHLIMSQVFGLQTKPHRNINTLFSML